MMKIPMVCCDPNILKYCTRKDTYHTDYVVILLQKVLELYDLYTKIKEIECLQ